MPQHLPHKTKQRACSVFFDNKRMAHLRSLTLWVALSSLTIWHTTDAFVAPRPAHFIDDRRVAYRLNVVSEPNHHEHANVVLQDFALYNGEIVDPYETLQVDRQANEATIKKAYRHLCRRCHPDAVRQHAGLLGDDDKGLREQWERITWSYELLSDTRQRRKYDVHYAVAYPGQTLRRAASALACLGLAALSKGLATVKSLAMAKVFEYQQAQYQEQQRMTTLTEETEAEQLEEQALSPQTFFHAGFNLLSQGLTRISHMVASKIMEHHLTNQQEKHLEDSSWALNPTTPLFALEGAGRPIGCQPFSVAIFDDIVNMVSSLKKVI